MLKLNLEASIDNLNYMHYMEEYQQKEKDDNEKRKNDFQREQTTPRA